MIKIETTENLIKINGIRFGKNTLNYWANGHNLFIGSGLNSGFIVNNVKFDKITFNGVTPSTITELLSLFDSNFFKSASQGGGETSLTFSNGLTEEDGEVKLGGQLTEQLTIIGRGNPLTSEPFNGIFLAEGQNYFSATDPNDSVNSFKVVTAYNSGFFYLQDANNSSKISFLPNELIIVVDNGGNGNFTGITLTENSCTYGSSTNTPINYQSDYSINYTDRSLVDRGYLNKTLSSMITGVNRVYSQDPDLFEFNQTGYYTHNGDEDLIRVLPDASTSAGTRYVILNTTGIGGLEIQGNIFESGVVITSFNVTPGETYIIYSNGEHWVIV